MMDVRRLSIQCLGIATVLGLAFAAAACTPYQYSGNRPVALNLSVNGPGPMSPQGSLNR